MFFVRIEVCKMVSVNSLIEGINEVIAYKKGEITLETETFSVPCVVSYIHVDAREIREKLSLTQEQFSEKYQISLATLRNWEQGSRRPRGAARVLLRLINAEPELIARLLFNERHTIDL